VPSGTRSATVSPGRAVAVVSSARSGDVTIYRLRVTQGRNAVVIVPADADLASLEVNGVERERVGYNFPVGMAPLGHGLATFPLENVGPTDDVVVRVWGSREPLRILDDSRLVVSVHDSSFLSGAYYAVLGIVAFFIVASLCVERDPTLDWYLCYTISLILIELTRDDALPFKQATNVVCLLASIALCTVAVVGFYVSYLRLWTEARRLLYALAFWTVAPWVLDTVFLAMTHRPLVGEALVPPLTVVLIACIAIAAIRLRQGYKPALYIAIGFLGLSAALFSDIARSLMHAPSPSLTRWEIELGSAFDVLAFAVAVTIRSRYSAREKARIKHDLDGSFVRRRSRCPDRSPESAGPRATFREPRGVCLDRALPRPRRFQGDQRSGWTRGGRRRVEAHRAYPAQRGSGGGCRRARRGR
jgi:hypothetical protein